MKFNAEEISKHDGAVIEFIDRDLPFEKKFARELFPDFLEQELQMRAEAILAQCPKWCAAEPDLDLNIARTKKASTNPSAFVFSDVIEDLQWSKAAREFGKRVLGNNFSICQRSLQGTSRAVIAPLSPVLTLENYWRHYTGLDGAEILNKTIDELCLRHELGHVYLSFSPKDGKKREIAYLSEVLADVYAIETYLNRGGNKAAVLDRILSRRMCAFLGSASPSHATAKACEDALQGKPISPFGKDFAMTRELQIRAVHVIEHPHDTKNFLDGKAFRKEVNYAVAYEEDGAVKQESCWTAPVSRAALYPPLKLMAALVRVLKEANLSKEVRSEGLATVKAYEHFCPRRAEEAFRPCVSVKPSSSPTR